MHLRRFQTSLLNAWIIQTQMWLLLIAISSSNSVISNFSTQTYCRLVCNSVICFQWSEQCPVDLQCWYNICMINSVYLLSSRAAAASFYMPVADYCSWLSRVCERRRHLWFIYLITIFFSSGFSSPKSPIPTVLSWTLTCTHLLVLCWKQEVKHLMINRKVTAKWLVFIGVTKSIVTVNAVREYRPIQCDKQFWCYKSTYRSRRALHLTEGTKIRIKQY